MIRCLVEMPSQTPQPTNTASQLRPPPKPAHRLDHAKMRWPAAFLSGSARHKSPNSMNSVTSMGVGPSRHAPINCRGAGEAAQAQGARFRGLPAAEAASPGPPLRHATERPSLRCSTANRHASAPTCTMPQLRSRATSLLPPTLALPRRGGTPAQLQQQHPPAQCCGRAASSAAPPLAQTPPLCAAPPRGAAPAVRPGGRGQGADAFRNHQQHAPFCFMLLPPPPLASGTACSDAAKAAQVIALLQQQPAPTLTATSCWPWYRPL